MKMNDIGAKDVERKPITEKEMSKVKELTAAPVKAETADAEKAKLAESKGLLSERLTQQKEVQSTTAEAEKPTEDKGFKHDFAEIEDELNKGSYSPSFGASPGVCRDSRTNQNYCVFAGF